MNRPRISAVIPVLDEADNLQALLPDLAARVDEIVVSDGGSRDGGPDLARSFGATVVEGPPGRGGQLDRGARAATGEILLFLHADTRLADGAIEAIHRALAEGARCGAFFLRFDRPTRSMSLASWLINHRTRLTRLPLGDQTHFVTRETYEALGGYPHWPILEDVDFARRMKRTGSLALLEPPIVTSARRYARGGLLRTAMTNWLIWFLFALGVPARRLGPLYRKIR